MRFLIVRLSALGDVVCTLPVATSLRRQYPDAEITWVVDRRFAGIVECCDAISEIVVAPKGFAASRSLVATLGKFDCAFDMQGLMKSGLLVGLAKANQKLGYHWQREGAWLFSSPVMPDPTSIHIVDQYIDVARSAGANADRAEFGLVPNAQDLESVQGKLATIGVDLSRPLIVMNAGAGWATKRWPAEHFAMLADRLAEVHGQSVFIGTDADQPAFMEVVAHTPNAIDFLGKTNVRELVALCSLASLHVAGDTGSTHLSAALGKPCIGLYVLTKPERSCPYGQIENSRDLDPVIVADRALRLIASKVPA